MNKTCARCEKTVYPTEELKCLDKVWHKGCFKCQECGMTLNMRTYKGYGKLPYCEAHVPKAKHTTMAETPELKRIAENTKIQSNVKYHADFEKSKGKFTQVADDPETLRIKANTKIISNVAYHGDLEKKAQMERQRQINENGELVEVQTDYHQQIESYASEMLPAAVPPPSLPQKNHYQTPANYHQQPTRPQQNYSQKPQTNSEYDQYYRQQKYAEYQYQNQNQNQTHHNQNQTHPQNQIHQNQNQIHLNQNQSQKYEDFQYAYGQYHQPQNYGVGSQHKIGRIQDYDPLSDGPRAPPNTQRASATLIYNSTSEGKRGAGQVGQATRADLEHAPHQHHQHPQHQQQHHQQQHQQHQKPAHQTQRVYIAMYDYEANDSDEVSFREGDLISNVTSIDEGWMTGQVLSTGRTGMLPANYVELAPADVIPHQYAK